MLDTTVRPQDTCRPQPLLPFFSARMSLPPGINQSYKIITVKNEAHIEVMRLGATEELEQFKAAAGWELKAAPICDWLVVEAIKLNKKTKTPLSVQIRFYFPTLWKRDVDGGEKHAIDVAFKHLGLNDNLVVDLRVTKEADREDPRCEIEICCLVR